MKVCQTTEERVVVDREHFYRYEISNIAYQSYLLNDFLPMSISFDPLGLALYFGSFRRQMSMVYN